MSQVSDEIKLNCAGEFLTACDDEYEISTSVEVLAVLVREKARFDYIWSLARALTYACEQLDAKDLKIEEGWRNTEDVFQSCFDVHIDSTVMVCGFAPSIIDCMSVVVSL
jgi:hypothetical protein